jgi:hypothetical protein
MSVEGCTVDKDKELKTKKTFDGRENLVDL